MSKIKNFKVKKIKSGKYKGKFLPTFYFEDETIRPKRVYALAGKERETQDKAEIYKYEHNQKEDAYGLESCGIASPDMKYKLISDLLDEYILYLKNEKHVKETTIIDKRIVIENVIKPFFEDKVLAQLDEEIMREYLNYCYNQKNRKVQNGEESRKLSPRRIQKFWEVIKSFINWMIKRKYITADPTRDIARPKSNNLTVSKYWKIEEFKQFLSVIPCDSQDRALFLLAFLTGMRKGEVLGLTWSDIDFENDDIKIDKQFNDKIHRVDTTKTSESVRITKMPTVVKEELLRLKNRMIDYYGMTEGRLNKMPVFMNHKFEHYPSRTLATHMTNYIAAANVKKIKFHELRNSFITNAIDNGIPVDVIADMVGHKDVMTTLNIYKCTTSKHKTQAKHKIDDFACSLFDC